MAERGGGKKQKMELALEEEELRSLRIPSSAHRGNLSPSKNSFLPTLQEQAQERALAGGGAGGGRSGDPRMRGGGGALANAGASARDAAGDDAAAASARRREAPDQQVMAHLSAELLEGVKQDFLVQGGALTLEQFAKAMLRQLEPQQPAAVAMSGPAGGRGRGIHRTNSMTAGGGGGVRFADGGQASKESVGAETRGGGGGGYPAPAGAGGGGAPAVREPVKGAARAAAVIDLFHRVDVHSEGTITWDEVSNYLIEQGMAGSDEFTVDSIKTYEPSPVVDQSKHESAIEKLVYLEQIDAVACLSHNNRSFRLYDPKRCVVRNEVSGHRGTVISCCYVDGWNQIATTSADMTICMWDSSHLALRNRMSAKDVQLCLQWDAASQSLFSGSIDGTLSRWDLQNMCLADTRRGQHKKAINDLLMVEDINLLASASSDGAILMWDTASMRPKKTFKGHRKGTFSLAYSMDYRCLLTAGLDQEALVWNPYVERVPIFRLQGHTHALCGVAVVPGTPQILSADVAGVFRLWDMRNFRCVQSFGGNETQVNDLNTFCAMPPHRRIAAGSNKVLMFDYMDEWGGENATDTGGVTDALYNPRMAEFYTASKQSVKAWNASTGVLFKVLRDVTKHEITAVCLSDNCKKLYLGDASGRVGAHGLNNGALLTEFDKHATDISCLSVWKGTNKVISSSWDGVVKVHTDERASKPQLKAEFQHHRDGVTCLACSPELMLLASGGMDMQVCLYDLKTLKSEHSLGRLQHVIAGLSFMPSRCMLAVADQGGYVSLWRVRPHHDKWQRVYYFKNLPLVPTPSGTLKFPAPGEEKGPPIPLSALAVGPAQPMSGAKPLIYTADAKGGLRCWDLSPLCERRGIVEVDVRELFERQHYAQLASVRGPGDIGTQPLALGMPARALAASSLPVPEAAAAAPPSPAATVAGAAPSAPASAGGAGAFLTGLEMEGPGDGRDSRGSNAPHGTTVRAAVKPTASELSMLPRPTQTQYAPSAQQHDVHLLYEAEGHEEAVVSLHLTEQPRGLISCGYDRRVRTWSLRLDRCGMLLQSKDPAFRFPYDPAAAQQRKLEEGAELLQRIGPWSPGPKLPPLVPLGRNLFAANGLSLDAADNAQDRLARQKHGLVLPRDEAVAAERLARAMAALGGDDFGTMFQQMERLGNTLSMDIVADTAQDRLVRHAQQKHAEHMPHRTAALSRDEAAAADRLARAMAALGGDDFGTYAAMAKSIRPKGAAAVGAGDG